jgi:peptide/nickel transport system permease protein
VEAAKVAGASDARILFHEILPNALPLIITQMTLMVGGVILLEAALDFIGLGDRRVLYVHALRNALLPVITIIGSDLGMLLSGAVLIETVFAYPGLGRLTLEVLAARDYPVLMGLFLLISIAVTAMNFVTDIIYPLVDPRIIYRR